jgi:hypothetical protein
VTPKERVLAALRREEADYAPCAPLFWSSPTVPGYEWASEEERVEVCVNRLGVDAFVSFGVGLSQHPEVRQRTWEEQPAGERYPLLHKVIETPAGGLTCTVRKTEDWPHGDDIPLMSDFVVSRAVKPWIETEQDMDCFEHCWQPPRDMTDAELARSIGPVRGMADRWRVPIRAVVGTGLTTALSLFGAQHAVLLSVDRPELIDRLAEIEHRATMKRIELCGRAGVDFLSRNGWYETTDFWSPAQIERFLVPRLRRERDLAHEFGLPVAYTVCTGIMPMIEQLRSLAFDCLFAIEPVLGDQDMGVIARELGPVSCIWAGLSAPMHIGRGTPEQVRQAVRDFYGTFGRRGTILMATASIRPQWPWENVMAMVDEWQEQRYAR